MARENVEIVDELDHAGLLRKKYAEFVVSHTGSLATEIDVGLNALQNNRINICQFEPAFQRHSLFTLGELAHMSEEQARKVFNKEEYEQLEECLRLHKLPFDITQYVHRQVEQEQSRAVLAL